MSQNVALFKNHFQVDTVDGKRDTVRCSCGNEFRQQGEFDDTQCSTPCPSDSSEYCGRYDRQRIYYVQGTSVFAFPAFFCFLLEFQLSVERSGKVIFFAVREQLHFKVRGILGNFSFD